MTEPTRTHPWSPLLQAVPAFPVALAFLIGPGRDLVQSRGLGVVAVTLIGAVLGYVVLAAVSWVMWSRRTYWIDADGDLRLDSGVVQRSSRRLQLSRLQSIDIISPFLARLAGLVEVRVEAAGTTGTRIVLRYLTREDAERLRAMVLQLSRRAGSDVPAAEMPGSQVLASVPPGRLVVSLLLRSVTAALLALSVAFLALTALTQGPAGILLALITGGVPILSVAGEFLADYGFRVDRTDQGLRLRSGLLSTKVRTVPPDRVHAVAIISPLLWRRRDWVRVTVTIAGVEGESDRSGPEVLIPVAPRAEAMDLIRQVLPGVDVSALPFVAAPVASRWRSPIAWRALAAAVTPDVIASREGRITQRISIAPHAHVQSVRVTQGAWERRLGLASLHADTAPGPVRVIGRHLAADSVRPLADREADLVHLAQRSA